MTTTRHLWSDGSRQEAQKIVDWLLAAKLENGWPVGPDFDVALIELAECASPKLSRVETWRLVNELSKTGGTSLDDFERLWNAGRGLSTEAEREWRFWLPLSVAPGTGVRLPLTVTILGTRFTFKPAASVERSLAKRFKEAPEYVHHRNNTRERPPTTFVTFIVRGEEWQAAWRAGAAWDAFRGLSEFAFGRGQLRLMGQGPRSRVLHPTWLLALAPDRPLQFGEFALDYGLAGLFRSEFTLTEAAVQRLRKLAAPLKREPPQGSTLAIVADALRLYAQAMDAAEPHGCMLGLWQLAEAVTVADESRGKMDEVAARLGVFIRWPPVGASRALRYLGHKRINIVHRGIHEIDFEDVNILQLACEAALGWLLRDWRRLPSRNHLREFYRCVTRGDPELEAVAEAVAYIRAHRQRKQVSKPDSTPRPSPR